MDFVTSDLHLNHANICRLADRPFSSLEQMNEALIGNWNDTVASDDRVFVLGDLFMGPKHLWSDLRAQLNGRITLILGNHDGKGEKYSFDDNRRFMELCGIDEVLSELYFHDEASKLTYWMHHFPPYGYDARSDARDYKRPQSQQSYDAILYGHTHSKGIYDIPGGLHVGVDAHDFTPVSFDRLLDLWNNRHPQHAT